MKFCQTFAVKPCKIGHVSTQIVQIGYFFQEVHYIAILKHKPKQCILQTHTGDALDVTLCNLLKLRVLATFGLKDEFPVLRRRVSLGD